VYSFGTLTTRKTPLPVMCLENGSKSAKGLEHRSDGEWLRELEVFSLEAAQGRHDCSLQLPERSEW